MNEESILCVGEDYNKLLRDNCAVVAKAVRDAWLKLCLKIPADKVLYVAGPDEKAFMISSSGFILIPELQSNQIEADTRIFLHIQHIQSFQHIAQATIQATDTDVLVLAIGFAVEYRLKVYFYSSMSRKKLFKFIDCSLIAHRCIDYYKFNPKMWMVLHALSGCDTTSFIRNISKQKIFKTFFKQPSVYSELINMDKLPTTAACMLSAEQLLIECTSLASPNLDELRTIQAISHLRSTSSKSFLDTLLPTTNAFQYHCKRVSLQCNIWFQSLLNDISYPPLNGNGYCLVDGDIAIEWKSTPSMPDTTLLITCNCQTYCSTKRCKCFKYQLKCTILCKCKSCENRQLNTQPYFLPQQSARKICAYDKDSSDDSEFDDRETDDDEDKDKDESDSSIEYFNDDVYGDPLPQPFSVEYDFPTQLSIEYDDPTLENDIHSFLLSSDEW
ncbi:unnamed protein product [Didymodactylos carnosus]|uniref:CRC domain-containing protein n=1 Tax=Didymodactylos carnosus TaxID=1234261 RepID=A0A813XN03_9BILA|nr:unnamed protein product [Didymodactylos carnosus]CAF3655019.1 unnamed protein product [Didymodactylos carnosus]